MDYLAQKKETKIILTIIYYSPQIKNSVSLEAGEETKLLHDSDFEILYELDDISQNQKKTFFFPGLPCPLKLNYSHVVIPRGPKYAQEP